MRISTRKIKAEDCPTDVFVYIPSQKMFLFVDNKDFQGDKVELIFEEGINEEGLITKCQTFHKNTELLVVDDYVVHERNLYR